MAYLGVRKGLRLWIPDENRFIELAMVRFPNKLKDVPIMPASKTVQDKPVETVMGPKNKEFSPLTPVSTGDKPPVNKLSLQHVMTLMRLGDFTDKIEFHNQELIVDKMIELCQFYNVAVPNTSRQCNLRRKKSG